MCHARREGPRTPSTTTDANLNDVLLETHFFTPIIDFKSQHNTIELVTIPGPLAGDLEELKV